MATYLRAEERNSPVQRGRLPSAESRDDLEIASALLPAYRDCLMGQQHRVTVKRKRRQAYIERKRVAAKTPRRAPAKSRSKKTAPAAS